jgi:hypothetical protein
MEDLTFIGKIKKEQPALWEQIVTISKDGLIIVDEENDAVTATNRLLWTYPGIHDALATIVDQWSNKHSQKDSEENFKNIIQNIKENQND